MNKSLLFAMIVILIAGFYLMTTAMAPEATAHITSNCYDLLNAAGQVVGTACH